MFLKRSREVVSTKRTSNNRKSIYHRLRRRTSGSYHAYSYIARLSSTDNMLKKHGPPPPDAHHAYAISGSPKPIVGTIREMKMQSNVMPYGEYMS